MENLLSGIFGGLAVFALQITYDVFKKNKEKKSNIQNLKNNLYLEFFVLLQTPIEKFNKTSNVFQKWYIDMEHIHMRLAILGDSDFIGDYLVMLKGDGEEDKLRYKYINTLRKYFGCSQLSEKDYRLLVNSPTSSGDG